MAKSGLYKYTPTEADNINLGQVGCAVLNDTDLLVPPPNMVIVAIQVLGSGSKIASLIAEDPDRWFNTAASAFADYNGSTWNVTQALYTGFTMYGRWTQLQLAASSSVIVYFGE